MIAHVLTDKQCADNSAVLKAKGYTPFFKGSQLHFYSDKMQTCRMGEASAMPSADDKQAKGLTSADVDKQLDTLFEANNNRFCAQSAANVNNFRKQLQGNLL